LTAKIISIRLGFGPAKGSKSFGLKMDQINEFEDITSKYQKINRIKNNYLSKLPAIKEEEKQSKLIANKTLSVLNNFDLDALDLSEKEDHDEDLFKFLELHEKQVSGFLPSTKVNESSSNFSSFLFSWDSSCYIYRLFIDVRIMIIFIITLSASYLFKPVHNGF
jgi:hypothetical protein